MHYDEKYYEANAQDKDRPALWFYERVWRRYCGTGPVLEFGCGVGYLSKRLSKHTSVFGYEINAYAQQRFPRTAPEARLVKDLSDIPDRSLNSIVALHVLGHITDDQLALIGKQFVRMLKNDGKLIKAAQDKGGCVYGLKQASWLAFTDATYINLKSATAWRVFFEITCNLNVVRSSAYGYNDFANGATSLKKMFVDEFRAIRTALQFLLGRMALAEGDGEVGLFLWKTQK